MSVTTSTATRIRRQVPIEVSNYFDSGGAGPRVCRGRMFSNLNSTTTLLTAVAEVPVTHIASTGELIGPNYIGVRAGGVHPTVPGSEGDGVSVHLVLQRSPVAWPSTGAVEVGLTVGYYDADDNPLSTDLATLTAADSAEIGSATEFRKDFAFVAPAGTASIAFNVRYNAPGGATGNVRIWLWDVTFT